MVKIDFGGKGGGKGSTRGVWLKLGGALAAVAILVFLLRPAMPPPSATTQPAETQPAPAETRPVGLKHTASVRIVDVQARRDAAERMARSLEDTLTRRVIAAENALHEAVLAAMLQRDAAVAGHMDTHGLASPPEELAIPRELAVLVGEVVATRPAGEATSEPTNLARWAVQAADRYERARKLETLLTLLERQTAAMAAERSANARYTLAHAMAKPESPTPVPARPAADAAVLAIDPSTASDVDLAAKINHMIQLEDSAVEMARKP